MISLAIKYRPTDFSEVLGQTATIAILKKQIQTNNVKNTFIFCGPSGVGKTTLARLFVKELNGESDTAIEIDAASNNGVDNVRNLINTANEHSVLSKYKVFIIDEAHMLTTAAWNALLKTIEEPPKFTIFIFCTTNVEKIPTTILNRCQRFEFVKVASVLIKERLEFICRQEGFTNFEQSIEYISTHCNNQVRDSITMLGQVADFNTNFDLATTMSILGGVPYDYLFTLLLNVLDGNEEKVFENFDAIKMQQVSAKNFVEQLLQIELEVNKYIVLHSMTFSSIPAEYENKIKNLIAYDTVELQKKVHSYLLKNLLELYTTDALNFNIILAYLIKLTRFE